jgi:aminoglycoside 3-N-acetyltransferase
MEQTRSISAAVIRDHIRRLGICDKPVCIHASLASFGRVEGGACAIVESFLSEGCTILAPTFTDWGVPPPAGWRLARNGSSYENMPATSIARPIFTINSLDIAPDMGAIPKAVLTNPNHVRGNHPLCSLTAAGPLATSLVSTQTPSDVFAPLRVLDELGGSVLLMGVGLNRMTALHLAENMAGRNAFVRWARGADGEPIPVRVGGCSEGFEKLAPALSSAEQRSHVGAGSWRLWRITDVLSAANVAIRASPEITHCANPDCIRCNDAVAGGPQASD